MIEKNILIFTETEEEFANLLIDVGTKKNVAKVLVYLLNTTEATTRVIERGTDLRQPEVSTALKYMVEHGWVMITKVPSERNGRPNNNYSLAIPKKEIIEAIEEAKKTEVNDHLTRIKKIRNYV